MHELALAKGIIEIVRSEAKKQHFTKVEEITLRVGEYSGIIPECLEEFFPIAAAGTPAEKAVLVFLKVPARFACRTCGYTGAVDRSKACCPECGSEELRMTEGREFFVESMRVE